MVRSMNLRIVLSTLYTLHCFVTESYMACFNSFLLNWRFSCVRMLPEIPVEEGGSMENLLASGGRQQLSKIARYLLCKPPLGVGVKVSLELDLSCVL